MTVCIGHPFVSGHCFIVPGGVAAATDYVVLVFQAARARARREAFAGSDDPDPPCDEFVSSELEAAC